MLAFGNEGVRASFGGDCRGHHLRALPEPKVPPAPNVVEPIVVVLEAPVAFLPLRSTALPAVFLAPPLPPLELVDGFRIESVLLDAEEWEAFGYATFEPFPLIDC